jgi:hypothetical protein
MFRYGRLAASHLSRSIGLPRRLGHTLGEAWTPPTVARSLAYWKDQPQHSDAGHRRVGIGAAHGAITDFSHYQW